jgi:4-hydroxy 2-oxovalerate aldolase
MDKQLNDHPRVAMAYRQSDESDKFVNFYDKVTSPEASNSSTLK